MEADRSIRFDPVRRDADAEAARSADGRSRVLAVEIE